MTTWYWLTIPRHRRAKVSARDGWELSARCKAYAKACGYDADYVLVGMKPDEFETYAHGVKGVTATGRIETIDVIA